MESEKEHSDQACCDAELQAWLETAFGNEKIPPFEENPAFIEKLRMVMVANKQAKRDTLEVANFNKQLASEYDRKAQELRPFVDMVQLSSESWEKVDLLASLAVKLNLKEPNFTNFVLAITDLENEEVKVKEEKLVDEFRMASLKAKIAETVKTNEFLERKLAQLNTERNLLPSLLEQVEGNSQFLVKRLEEYAPALQTREENIKDQKIKDLQHGLLVKKQEEYKQLQKDIEKLEAKLTGYEQLPPDEDLAALRILETIRELKALEEELRWRLDSTVGGDVGCGRKTAETDCAAGDPFESSCGAEESVDESQLSFVESETVDAGQGSTEPVVIVNRLEDKNEAEVGGEESHGAKVERAQQAEDNDKVECAT